MERTVRDKFSKLQDILRSFPGVLVAYSGGVDSAFLAKVAYDCLGDRAVALTALSPSYPTYEWEAAQETARWIGIRHLSLQTNELKDPRYRANRGDRCYFCKTELFEVCKDKAHELGIETIVSGVIVDDWGDFRPGLQAGEEQKVKTPLVDAGLTKLEIRERAKKMGLPVWDKPALACLSSRFPPGTEVTEERLKRIDAIETELHRMGFRQFRVRFHEPVARIEVGPEEFARFIESGAREKISEVCRQNGFSFTALDLDGYRMGSVNGQ